MLRHSMRTNLTLKGVDERIIDAIMGHTTKEMADRYRHIAADNTRGPMRAALELPPLPSPRPAFDPDLPDAMLDVFDYALRPA